MSFLAMLGGDGFVQPLAPASIIGQQTWIEPEPEWRSLDWQLLDELGLAPDCGYLADLGIAATHRRQGIGAELVRLGWQQYPDKPMLLRLSAGVMRFCDNVSAARGTNSVSQPNLKR